MFESRGVALGVVAAVFALVVGFVLGQATAPATLVTAPPAAADERPTAAEAKVRSDEDAFKDAQIAGLTARVGAKASSWAAREDGRLPPQGFYAKVRAARSECHLPANLIGVECSEPPCIALFRESKGDAAAELRQCGLLAAAFPTPRIEVAKVACPSGREETAVFYSPGAREDRPTDAVAAEDARLVERRAALVAGWPCVRAVGDVAH